MEFVERFLDNPEYFTNSFSNPANWISLNWFPYSTIYFKRLQIKQLILDLKNLGEQQSKINYLKLRNEVYEKGV